jgi:predicted nucleotidyltransferase
VRIFYPRLSRAEVIQLLSQGLSRLQAELPLERVVLFGSYAKGNYTVGSDVDLLIIYRGDPRPDAYAVVKKVLNVPRLEPHLYTEDEYRRLKPTLDRMSADGIVLFCWEEEKSFESGH